MNKNVVFDFSVNKQNNTITVNREFSAKLYLVWDAYTKREILDQWWAPRPWKVRTKSMEFREGGCWIYAMVGPAGEEHWARADYTSIVFQKRFTVLDAFSDAEGNVNAALPQSKWDVTFADKGGITLVEFRISYPDPAQLEATIQMGFREGLAMAMEGLDGLLATAEGE